MKILLCFGTRPEGIKMASLYHELKTSPFFDVKVAVTAQHREMLDQVLSFFEIVPDYDLDIMKKNQSLNELIGRIFTKIDVVLDDYKPDIVLVHGDTSTSTAVAMAAFHKGIKIGHIEAGLRTFNKYSPFPEEMNRQITGRIADFHFAPTEEAKNNLRKEGVQKEAIVITGNTVIDSLLWTVNKINTGYATFQIDHLKSLINFSKKVLLVTGHRRENFGDGFVNICKALVEISSKSDVEIVYPVHLNPNVRKPVMDILSGYSNIHLIEPLDYPTFVWMMMNSYIIITDSGGVQEEAPSLGKPVLVMRETTERPEAVLAGTVILVGTDKNKIVEHTLQLVNDADLYLNMSKAHNPYGDGNASIIIKDYLEQIL